MAVGDRVGRYIVLDGDYRIVEVGPAAEAGFGPLLGQVILDAFPDSRALYRPYYEQAKRTREPVEFAQYYDGYVMHVGLEPIGSKLVVTWDTLVMLDVLTLDGLKASMRNALSAISTWEDRLTRQRRRQTLRVVGHDA